MIQEPIKVVLFDLGNTLVNYYRREDFAPVLREAIVGISGELQRRGFPQDRNRLLERAWAFNVERDDHRVWPLDERLRELIGPPANDPTLMPQIAALFLRPIFRCARLHPEALATLRELRRRGLKTGIVSNTPWGSAGASWRSDLQRLGLVDAVDVIVFCTDVGWRKPAAAPFERALMQLAATPSQAVFVGDDPQWDIRGALNVGMKPVLFDPRDHHEPSDGVIRIEKLSEIPDLVSSFGSNPV
jgi:putative hydrolase of the HAD superfamily